MIVYASEGEHVLGNSAGGSTHQVLENRVRGRAARALAQTL